MPRMESGRIGRPVQHDRSGAYRSGQVGNGSVCAHHKRSTFQNCGVFEQPQSRQHRHPSGCSHPVANALLSWACANDAIVPEDAGEFDPPVFRPRFRPIRRSHMEHELFGRMLACQSPVPCCQGQRGGNIVVRTDGPQHSAQGIKQIVSPWELCDHDCAAMREWLSRGPDHHWDPSLASAADGGPAVIEGDCLIEASRPVAKNPLRPVCQSATAFANPNLDIWKQLIRCRASLEHVRRIRESLPHSKDRSRRIDEIADHVASEKEDAFGQGCRSVYCRRGRGIPWSAHQEDGAADGS